MSEKFLDQSGLVVLRDWTRQQIQSAGGSSVPSDAVLLWENATPTAEFQAQDIQIQRLVNYDGVIVEYIPYTGYPTTIVSPPIPDGCGNSLPSVGILENYYGGRYVTVFEDYVKFGYGHNHGTGLTHRISVPVAIYGVKGVTKPQTPVDEDAVYLIRAFDYKNADSTLKLSNFTRSLAISGNLSAICGWYFSDVGTGYTLLCGTESNSYSMATHLNGPITLSKSGRIEVDVGFRGYNQANAVGLLSEATYNSIRGNYDWSAVKPGTNYTDMISKFSLYQRVSDSWSNAQSAYIFKTLTLDLSSLSSAGDYRLAMCCAGASTAHLGGLCIQEARLYTS